MIETKNGVGAGGLLLAVAGGAVLGFAGAFLLLRDPERVQRWVQRATKGFEELQASFAQQRDDLAEQWHAASSEAHVMTDEEALAAATVGAAAMADPEEEPVATRSRARRTTTSGRSRRKPAKRV